MKNLLKLEEGAQFVGALYLFSTLTYAWWVFPVCLLLPDLSALGYLLGNRWGAYSYNFFHHKLVAVVVLIIGFSLHFPPLSLAGCILFGHSALDRVFGYGLKYTTGFQHTHLGDIGNNNKNLSS